MGGFLDSDIKATRGILAGHGFALGLIHVYYFEPMDAYMAAHPEVELDVYVDDITVTIEDKEDNHSRTAGKMLTAATDMRVLVEKELKCNIAWSKAACAASSSLLLRT